MVKMADFITDDLVALLEWVRSQKASAGQSQ